MKKKTSLLRLILVPMILCCCGCQNQDGDKTVIKVTAIQLSDEYLGDKNLAGSKYTGRIIEVNGSVEKVSQNISKKAYILLKTERTVHRVKCFLKKGGKTGLPPVREGSFVSVIGRCEGELMGDIVLKDCTVK